MTTVSWVVTWSHSSGVIQTRHFNNAEAALEYIGGLEQRQWVKLAKLETTKTEIRL